MNDTLLHALLKLRAAVGSAAEASNPPWWSTQFPLIAPWLVCPQKSSAKKASVCRKLTWIMAIYPSP